MDERIHWGESSLSPSEVSRTVGHKPWNSEPTVVYGAERLSLDEDDGGSIFDVHGEPIPIRGMIVRELLSNREEQTPWKIQIRSKFGSGWLVVEETGWKFHPERKGL